MLFCASRYPTQRKVVFAKTWQTLNFNMLFLVQLFELNLLVISLSLQAIIPKGSATWQHLTSLLYKWSLCELKLQEFQSNRITMVSILHKEANQVSMNSWLIGTLLCSKLARRYKDVRLFAKLFKCRILEAVANPLLKSSAIKRISA